jgi:hypothetical protein
MQLLNQWLESWKHNGTSQKEKEIVVPGSTAQLKISSRVEEHHHHVTQK